MKVRGDCRQDIVYRWVGKKPRESVLQRLRRRWPSVRLMWLAQRKRWVLLQVDRSPPHVISILQTVDGRYVEPTVENTVGYLDRVSPSNFRNQWAVERWIEKNLVDEPQDPALDDRHMGRVEEMADRIWRLGKTQIVRPGG